MTLYVAILTSHPERDMTTNVAKKLVEGGFLPHLDTAAGRPSVPNLVVAILDDPTPELMLDVGYRVAQRTPLLVISDSAIQRPKFIQPTCWIDSREPNYETALLVAARALLNISELPIGASDNVDLLLEWLRKDWSRLGMIDSRGLVQIAELLFKGSGWTTAHLPNVSDFDLLVRSNDLNISWMVSCKATTDNRSIGIGDIQRLHSACSRAKADLSMLVSNSTLTASARVWASQCAPPVHVLERKDLEALLRQGLTAQPHKAPLQWRPAVLHSGRQVTAHLADAESTYLSTVRRARRLRDEHVFVTSCAYDASRSLPAELAALRTQLEARGVRLLHEGIDDNATLQSVAAMARDASVVVLLASTGASGAPRWNDRLLQVVAHECSRVDLHDEKQLFVVAPDNPFSKLRVPTCMAQATFVDNSDTSWVKEVLQGVDLHFSVGTPVTERLKKAWFRTPGENTGPESVKPAQPEIAADGATRRS